MAAIAAEPATLTGKVVRVHDGDTLTARGVRTAHQKKEPTMSGNETYNGWRNVETWGVQQHITNDKGETFHALNYARWLIETPVFNNNCSDPDYGTVEDPSSRMGVYLRDYVSQATGRAASDSNTHLLSQEKMRTIE